MHLLGTQSEDVAKIRCKKRISPKNKYNNNPLYCITNINKKYIITMIRKAFNWRLYRHAAISSRRSLNGLQFHGRHKMLVSSAYSNLKMKLQLKYSLLIIYLSTVLSGECSCPSNLLKLNSLRDIHTMRHNNSFIVITSIGVQ